MKKKIPIGISARHVHLSQLHQDILFGKDYCLSFFKQLSQPNQFACVEKVKIITLGGKELEARVLGPLRNETQVEVSKGDVLTYKFESPLHQVPIRSSGDTENSGVCTLVGPKGSVVLSTGVIIADRHIHMNENDAQYFGVKNGDKVYIKLEGPKKALLGDVLIRVSHKFVLDCHLDTDDSNANLVSTGDTCTLIKRKL